MLQIFSFMLLKGNLITLPFNAVYYTTMPIPQATSPTVKETINERIRLRLVGVLSVAVDVDVHVMFNW